MNKFFFSNKRSQAVDLSIIVINYNTKKITYHCINSLLTSLRRVNFKFEILLVDNGSSDGSISFFKKKFKGEKRIKLILNQKNLGFGKANNQAVKYALGKYLLFLNSDTLILDKAIEKLFNYYQDNEGKIAFLGGKLLNKDYTDQPSAAHFFTLPVVFAALFLKGDYWGLTRFSPDKIKKVDWVSGAFILTKKEIFQKIGGFDENIFMYMDEVDLLYRAKKENYQTFFYPEAKIIHYGSLSADDKREPIIRVYQGLLYFYQKHYSLFFLLCLKFLLIIKAIIAILLGKIFNQPQLALTYKKALRMII